MRIFYSKGDLGFFYGEYKYILFGFIGMFIENIYNDYDFSFNSIYSRLLSS